jgi:hypothetical protein
LVCKNRIWRVLEQYFIGVFRQRKFPEISVFFRMYKN